MSNSRRPAVILRAAAVAAMLATFMLTGVTRPTARADTLSQLNWQLSQERARQQQLGASVGALSGMISSLAGQIALVESREAAVRQQLAADRAALVRVAAALKKERALVVRLRRRLAWARMVLARVLVSSYESNRPDLVSVVLDANGFNNLLEQFAFLGRAEDQQQTIITITRRAKQQADIAAARLAKLVARDRRITHAATLEALALQNMNALLQSKQAAMQRARYAQQLALQASQARAGQLQSQIAQIHAAQAAAAARAAAQAQAAAQAAPQAGTSAGAGPVLAPSGSWVIPSQIVTCESGGQDLPPNSAGASGFYQIIPSTWRLFGGTGAAAYLASKAEQDAVASRIWNGGTGASNWVCAGIVGIH